MFKVQFVRAASLLAALALGACAHVAVLPEKAPNHIASVEVVQHDKDVPPAFADALRETVTREAAFYGDAGKGYNLKIDVDQVHYKNFIGAFVGDTSHADGSVTLVDPATGKPEKPPVKFQVTAEPNAFSSASIAELVISMMDPTGFVDAANTVGNAASATFFRNGTAAKLITNFTDMALWRTFGDAKRQAAHAAKQRQGKAH